MTITIRLPDEPAFTIPVDDNADRDAITTAVENGVRAKHPRVTTRAGFTADVPHARTGTVRVNGAFGYWIINR